MGPTVDVTQSYNYPAPPFDSETSLKLSNIVHPAFIITTIKYLMDTDENTPHANSAPHDVERLLVLRYVEAS
jgi:hypothetical protein